jgi:hypothetical protein
MNFDYNIIYITISPDRDLLNNRMIKFFLLMDFLIM